MQKVDIFLRKINNLQIIIIIFQKLWLEFCMDIDTPSQGVYNFFVVVQNGIIIHSCDTKYMRK